MRKLVALGLVLGIALLLASSTSAAMAPLGARYDVKGGTHNGYLWLMHAEDRHFVVFDQFGFVRAEGITPEKVFVEPVSDAGADKQGTLLTVFIEPDIVFTLDDRGDWVWD